MIEQSKGLANEMTCISIAQYLIYLVLCITKRMRMCHIENNQNVITLYDNTYH